MKKFKVTAGKDWKVLRGTARSQAAIMVIAPGDSEGGPENSHPKSDQWLLVLSGAGQAVVEKKKIRLKENDLLLIEKGARHQIFCAGKKKLVTLNFYGPPAYL